MNTLFLAFLGGLGTFSLNALGAFLVFLLRKPSERFMRWAVAFSAGIMIVASFEALIFPETEAGSAMPTLLGIILGTLFIDFSDRLVPHRALERHKGAKLFIIAILLHKTFESVALGISFASGPIERAFQVFLAIGLHNIFVGLSTALVLLSAGAGATRAFYIASSLGLIQILAVLLGSTVVYLYTSLLPYAIGFAAGALLYAISHEMLPQIHTEEQNRGSTWAFITGVVLMLLASQAVKSP